MTDDREVLRGVSGTNPTLVLLKGDVEDPVEAILDAPARTERRTSAALAVGWLMMYSLSSVEVDPVALVWLTDRTRATAHRPIHASFVWIQLRSRDRWQVRSSTRPWPESTSRAE